jgi:vacuolar protein sorting-associated protein 13A/C
LSLHWLNLGNQPVQVLIEDLYVLVVPRKEDDLDPDELERRTQEVKLKRLDNAEVLQTQAAAIKGINSCSENTVTNLTASKVPRVTLKIKAFLHHSSQSF